MTDAIPAPGAVFADRYEIVRQLGEGAFGAVFEARMQPMMRRVAVKVLHPEVAGNRQLVARFVREARILGEIEHPHIVTIVDVGLAGSTPFLVMELLSGETLGARIRREGPMPAARALTLFLPICAAVHAVHQQGVVHRDLKPENIMLARQATGHVVPKVLDFGIAKSDERDGVATRTQAVMGTAHYMSPEQATDSKHLDGRSDQWALAVILWEMLTGEKLFQGPHQVAILSAVLSTPIPPLGQVVRGVPPSLEEAVARALSRDPGQRFATVGEFASRLLPAADTATQAQWTDVFVSPTASTDVQDAPPVASLASFASLPGTLHPAVAAPRAAEPRSLGRNAPIALAAATSLLAAAALGLALRGRGPAAGLRTVAIAPVANARAVSAAPATVTTTPAVAHALRPSDGGVLPALARYLESANPWVRQGADVGVAMQQHEVTEAEFARFEGRAEGATDRAVTGVEWQRAAAFCAAAGARLPPAAEWMAAYDTHRDPTRVRFGRSAPLFGDSRDRTEAGLRDIVGGVREWTSSAGLTIGMSNTDPASDTQRLASTSAAAPSGNPLTGFRCVRVGVR